jgi:hypothetical protein
LKKKILLAYYPSKTLIIYFLTKFMELNKKMSNVLKIFLAVVIVVLLLAIGGALGARFGRSHNAKSNNFACGQNANFERGGERGDRHNQRGGRMMRPNENFINRDNQIPVGGNQIPVGGQVNQGNIPIIPSAPINNSATGTPLK